MREMFDHEAAVKPLLDAVPGTVAICTCGLCGNRIHGPAAFGERGLFIHPEACPPPKPPK